MRLEDDIREQTAELQASRDLLRAVFDTSTLAIIYMTPIRDPQGEVMDFEWRLSNPSAQSYVPRGLTLDGLRFSEAFPGYYETGLFDRYRRVFETGAPT